MQCRRNKGKCGCKKVLYGCIIQRFFLHKKQIFLFSDPSECLEVLHSMLNFLDLRLPNFTEIELTKRLMLKILEERFKVGLKNENYFS